jgi:uncharacterized protein
MSTRPVKQLREDPSDPVECPKCHAAMRTVLAGDVQADRCQTCGGVWLDAREKETLLATRGAAKSIDVRTDTRPSSSKPPALKCPRDRSALIVMSDAAQPHVRYEACTVCGGSFFDAGELKDLDSLTLRERLRSYFPNS